MEYVARRIFVFIYIYIWGKESSDKSHIYSKIDIVELLFSCSVQRIDILAGSF